MHGKIIAKHAHVIGQDLPVGDWSITQTLLGAPRKGILCPRILHDSPRLSHGKQLTFPATAKGTSDTNLPATEEYSSVGTRELWGTDQPKMELFHAFLLQNITRVLGTLVNCRNGRVRGRDWNILALLLFLAMWPQKAHFTFEIILTFLTCKNVKMEYVPGIPSEAQLMLVIIIMNNTLIL